MFAQVVVAALGALPFITQGVTAAKGDCTRTYTVQPGDTCNSIGAANSASTFQIMAVNDDIDALCYNLMPGSSICLGTEGADCQDTYVVQAGDNCAKIEDAHNINSTMLMANNPNIDSDCWNIYTGEVLCVAQEVLVPDAPANFFKYESIATNQDPKPDTPYVPHDEDTDTQNVVQNVDGTYETVDSYEVVDPSDVEDGENVPYCDEVGL